MNSQNVTWPIGHNFFFLLWNPNRILLRCYFGDSEERNWSLQEGWETTGRLCTGSRDKFKNHYFLVKICCGCSDMEIWHPHQAIEGARWARGPGLQRGCHWPQVKYRRLEKKEKEINFECLPNIYFKKGKFLFFFKS